MYTTTKSRLTFGVWFGAKKKIYFQHIKANDRFLKAKFSNTELKRRKNDGIGFENSVQLPEKWVYTD